MSSELGVMLPPETRTLIENWQAQGLVPLEITPEDLIQRVSITHNAATGQFTWTTEKINEQAIGLLADVLYSMYRYWFKEPLRPRLNSGNARICIQLEGDSLSMAFGMIDPNRPEAGPINDPVVAKSILLAALFGLCERTGGGDFSPLDVLLSWKINGES